ncbi:hypothetical protein [Campylobacter sp.]|nr:hypothetical protein [Campylobacter sp.]
MSLKPKSWICGESLSCASYVRSLVAEILSETSLIGKGEQTRGKALF